MGPFRTSIRSGTRLALSRFGIRSIGKEPYVEHIKVVWFDKNGVTRETVSVDVNTTDEASKLVADLLLVMNPTDQMKAASALHQSSLSLRDDSQLDSI